MILMIPLKIVQRIRVIKDYIRNNIKQGEIDVWFLYKISIKTKRKKKIRLIINHGLFLNDSLNRLLVSFLYGDSFTG